MIPAIETQYKGYRFRSRTEARWAIYFDVCGIKWEYELEGYNLGKLGCYLPDFWLPQVNMWAEVKGKEFTTEERRKCIALAKLSRNSVLMLTGAPDYKWYPAVYAAKINGIIRIGEELFGVSDYHGYHISEHRFYGGPGCATPEEEGNITPAMIQAINAARSAHFEHGETPQVYR